VFFLLILWDGGSIIRNNSLSLIIGVSDLCYISDTSIVQ